MKETKNDQFDDRKLINLARYHLYAADEMSRDDIRELFSKEKLSNSERNLLVSFIESTKYIKPLSMREMKREIFAIIGKPESHYNDSQNVLNRDEVEHIFKYIKGLQNESDS